MIPPVEGMAVLMNYSAGGGFEGRISRAKFFHPVVPWSASLAAAASSSLSKVTNPNPRGTPRPLVRGSEIWTTFPNLLKACGIRGEGRGGEGEIAVPVKIEKERDCSLTDLGELVLIRDLRGGKVNFEGEIDAVGAGRLHGEEGGLVVEFEPVELLDDLLHLIRGGGGGQEGEADPGCVGSLPGEVQVPDVEPLFAHFLFPATRNRRRVLKAHHRKPDQVPIRRKER